MTRKALTKKQLALLRSVTPVEFANAKSAIQEWGEFGFAIETLTNKIAAINKQIGYVDRSLARGKANEETAKTKEILEMQNKSIVEELQKITAKHANIDAYVSKLDILEQSIIYMTYQEKLYAEIVAMRNHIGRATYFRKRDRALQEIALMMREEEKVKKDVC